jgi:alpha-glucuronidase
MRHFICVILAALLSLVLAAAAQAEDGYRLWLRYDPLPAYVRQHYSPDATEIVLKTSGAIAQSAAGELQQGLSGLLAKQVPNRPAVRDGAIVVRLIPDSGLGDEGYSIRTARIAGHRATVIEANNERGLLYGAFALLRRIQTRQPIDHLDIRDRPKLALRMLDHWDNLNGTVERGYAGRSLWDWRTLPGSKDPRYTDYARADASIGINGVVINNVNAQADILTEPYLKKVAALADILRPWGIRVFLSARFSAPMDIGGLKTADPLDPAVRGWWKAKADEVYTQVHDFGGFLVKANSEGEPGPQDYGRTHADGANMLADALRPHGGIVLWRAFVYSSASEDRAKQAYEEFAPLDGKFAENVVVQIKNGPIDFQPREPFHPLFGAMPHTKLAMEAQVTKEYLGFNTHLAYLGAMWEEVLKARTFRPVQHSRVSDTISAIAGVANVGASRSWSGSQFDQANWYALGRLAWDPNASSKSIAEEWTRMTWGNDPRVVSTVVPIMMGSRQAVVDYMTPLGLAHLMGTDHHYGPAPWVSDLKRPEWNPVYYHRADASGIGFDRTMDGSNALSQYSTEAQLGFVDVQNLDYLLWFQHVPWDQRLHTGRTVWDEIVWRYGHGVDQVRRMRRQWDTLRGSIDKQRFDEVAAYLAIQEREAKWWRDACIAYFQSVSKRPLPRGVAPPEHPLSYYEALRFPYAPAH